MQYRLGFSSDAQLRLGNLLDREGMVQEQDVEAKPGKADAVRLALSIWDHLAEQRHQQRPDLGNVVRIELSNYKRLSLEELLDTDTVRTLPHLHARAATGGSVSIPSAHGARIRQASADTTPTLKPSDATQLRRNILYLSDEGQ